MVILACGRQDTNQNQSDTPLRPYVENPRYWEYHGKPVLLLGGSKNDNLFQEESLEGHLDTMVMIGANYVRNTMSSRDSADVWPFQRNEQGLYDLNILNEVYWAKFEKLLKLTHERGIMVQIEVWDRFDFSRDNWQKNPFNPQNNINYSSQQVQLDTVYPQHPSSDLQPFFHSLPGMKRYHSTLDTLLKFQKNFVNAMLDHTLSYDHILYCINNETTSPSAWGRFWIEFIKDRAQNDRKEVYVTDMYDHFYHPASCQECQDLIGYPELYDFIDCSQINSRNLDQNHWDTLQYIMRLREQYNLRPVNNTKVYGGGFSSWQSGSNQDGVERFCRNIFGGAASARHHRPISGCGLNEKAIASIKAIRKLEEVSRMWDTKTAMQLVEDREPDEVYVISESLEKFALYFPSGGSVNMNLSSAPSNLTLKWISVSQGTWLDNATEVQIGSRVPISTPDASGWIAVLF